MSSLLWSFLVGPAFRNPRPLRPVGHSETRKTYLSVVKNLDIHKSTGHDRMHTQVLRELANVIVRLLLIIFKRPRQLGESSEKQKKANVNPIFKKDKQEDPENYRPFSLTLIPGKMMEQIILETNSKHIKDKKVIGSSQCGFTKGKSCLTNLIAFYVEMTSLMDEGRVVHVAYLPTLVRLFDILLEKLMMYGLDK